MPFEQNDKDIQQALKVHNEARKEVGVDKLIWSSKLQNDATIYAQELAKKDKGLAHSNRTWVIKEKICIYLMNSKHK